VIAYNRTRRHAEPLRADGAQIAGSPADAVRDAEALVTMLADDQAVADVLFGGAAEAMPRGAVHASMSTISVDLSRGLAEEHHRRGQQYVAAPVFGRPDAAAFQKLWIVAAGAERAVEHARPLLEAMGRGLTVVGTEPAAANAVKLAGNFTLASMIETLGEAFRLMRGSGVEPRQFLEVIGNALFQSPVYANYGGIIADEKFEPAGFKLTLGLKDVRLLLAAADGAGVPMPFAGVLRDRFLEAVAHGRGNSDWSAVAKPL
jgi:3-hydroxyisobutyrate dehydrogenase-like beta-hydroxyacid dehydrogenase